MINSALPKYNKIANMSNIVFIFVKLVEHLRIFNQDNQDLLTGFQGSTLCIDINKLKRTV